MDYVIRMFQKFSFFLFYAIIVLLVDQQSVIKCASEEEPKFRRSISAEVNPGCEKYSACESPLNNSLVHVTASGPEDTIHYIWTNYEAPSFLIARTNNNTKLTVDWAALLSDDKTPGIKFTEPPLYSFGVILAQIFEYSDEKNNGAFSGHESIFPLDVSNFLWNNVTDSLDVTKDSCSAEFRTMTSDALKYGVFSIQVSSFGKDTTEDILPHLLLTSNSTQLTFSIKDFVGNFSKGRYAFEMILMSSEEEERTSKFKLDPQKTLDDEYSPGVFRTFRITSSEEQNASCGYVVWKPVSYTGLDRLIAHSADATVKEITPLNLTARPNSIVGRFFNRVPHSGANFIVSFGTGGDGFYKNTNYTEWSAAIGYGVIREENISLLVLLVIIIGLGLPVLIMISGGIYLGARKLCHQRDELLLDRDSVDQ